MSTPAPAPAVAPAENAPASEQPASAAPPEAPPPAAKGAAQTVVRDVAQLKEKVSELCGGEDGERPAPAPAKARSIWDELSLF